MMGMCHLGRIHEEDLSVHGVVNSKRLEELDQHGIGPAAAEGPHALQVRAVSPTSRHHQNCIGIRPALTHRQPPAATQCNQGT